ELAEDIEKAISNKMITEVNSKIIGEMVMDRLKNLDEISYVRFASVYRQFKDINTFLEEIKNLVSNE
uniref:ATP cone domain-containing protein n=2 Tax=Clostridiaceae TaxID=31979 RepID=UPI00241F8BAB